MKIVGIVCEYDPFHRGHRRQFELIRQTEPDAYIVCLMSGCFTQRGMPALHLPRVRAEAALKAGCDMVLELPVAFSLRDAEHFADGAVAIFEKLGFITHLSFGTEDDISLLTPVAKLLCDDTLLPGLKEGLSYPAALEEAVAQSLPQCREALAKPNNILAIQYLRALYRRKSEIIPLPVRRQGDYHAGELSPEAYPSATAIRRAFLDGRFEEAEAAAGYPLPREPVCLPNSLDMPLLYQLRGMQPEDIAAYPHCSEGLENRALACARQATSREDLLAQLKTRRYPYTRLNRLLSHILLGMRQDVLEANPESDYVRLLGLRKDTKPLLSRLSESGLPIISKPADGNLADPLYRLDIRAYDLWALGAGLPAGLMFTQSPVIL